MVRAAVVVAGVIVEWNNTKIQIAQARTGLQSKIGMHKRE